MFKYFTMSRWSLTLVILALIMHGSLVSAQVASRFNILITEIFSDPTPSVGLPSLEFIEIRNVSAIPFNLKEWLISDGNSTATITVNYILQPDSAVIICANSAVANLSVFGSCIGVSNFPSLDNEADLISLRSPAGTVIHAVHYNKDWYQNDLKSTGGWTLEMIDPENPCGGIANWKASTNPSGGTPGRKNSVDGNNRDEIAPALLRTYNLDSVSLVAVFDEPLDSLLAANLSAYTLDRNLAKPRISVPVGPLFTEVFLKFSDRMSPEIVYNLTVNSVTDCTGNIIGMKNKSKTGLISAADTFDIVINEILFNPKSDGFDFIEVYNKSKKIINLQQVYVANRNATGGVGNIKQLSVVPYLFYPEEYIVITENTRWLAQNYIVKNHENILELPSLPTLPDDKGTVILLNQQGKSIEELYYDTKWHFALITDDEGISLERIDYNKPTQNKHNWTSAASTAGFATPGYQNSQFKADPQMQGTISISPKIFSPDNDGLDDLMNMQYQMTAPGYVANITIFDANGRPVKHLAKNATLALQGHLRWDGLNDQLEQLPVGIYIVFTEIFNLQGKTKKFKNVVTLARKF